ncbi:MAG: hypothetical protein K8W52_15910 [Deltaproteobacteria bacterium]|nr:hypothetical protein [Deltaproteobacteria bacterium]
MRLAIAMMLVLGACAVSEDRPDLSCKTDGDCFQAQGENCDSVKHVCVGPALNAAGPDGGAAIASDDIDVDDVDVAPLTSIGGAP